MQATCKNNDAIWYVMEQQSRLVAKTGIPSDRFHLGKLILQGLQDAPGYVMQVDGVTGEFMTFRQILEKTVRCAQAFRKLGIPPEAVVLLLASNCFNITIPYYAAFYNGNAVVGLDWTLGVDALQKEFEILNPKIIFCLSEKVQDVQLVVKNMNFPCHIVCFDGNQNVLHFDDFLLKYGYIDVIEDFRVTKLKPEKVVAVIIPTSGSTSEPKYAYFSHKAMFFHGMSAWYYAKKIPVPSKLALVTSPLQSISAHVFFIASPLLRITKLMYAKPHSEELLTGIINKYGPTTAILSPPMFTMLLGAEKCELRCFETVIIGGTVVHKRFLEKFKSRSPNTLVLVAYGATEFGISHLTESFDLLGQPTGHVRTRIVDVKTKEDIVEPYKNGELWAKGPAMFEGYYKNPKETKDALSEDGWFKSGDIFCKDESGNHYFVDRLKRMLNYKNNQILPVEIERVILQHPGVSNVAVVGIPSAEFGDLAVAFVVKNDDATVSATDIKNLVQQNLAETKHLHGGVIFIDEMPLTTSTKVHQRKLKEMALTMVRE